MPPSSGHAWMPGSRPRSTSSPLRTTSWQGAVATFFGGAARRAPSLPNASRSPPQPCGSSGLSSPAMLVADVVEPLDAERLGHPPLGAEHVDGQRHRRAADVLEQQRRAAGAHDALDDLGDLEVRVDLGLDAAEVPAALQTREEVAQIGKAQPHLTVARSAARCSRRPATDARVAVQADDEHVDHVVVDDQRAEGGDGEAGGALALPARGRAGVQVAGVDHPGDERPGLLGVPAPVATPGRLGPDGAGDDREGPDRERERDQAVGGAVERLRWPGAGRAAWPAGRRSLARYSIATMPLTKNIAVALIAANTWIFSQ